MTPETLLCFRLLPLREVVEVGAMVLLPDLVVQVGAGLDLTLPVMGLQVKVITAGQV